MNAHVATAIGSNGAGRVQEAGTQYEELFDGVDDLIKRVADVENPEIRKVRAKVHAALVAAKSAFGRAPEISSNGARSNGVHRAAVQAAESTDDFLSDDLSDYLSDDLSDDLSGYPGQALGVALLVGLGLGLIVSVRQ
jgi:ElaB/YqjD/DUF883 family membrane-anchored ribosome-binding protein